MVTRPVRLVAVGGAGLGIRFDVARPASAGETAFARSVTTINGGKASNQAIGAAVFGADASIISAIGRDEFAPLIRDPLVRHGVDVRSLIEFPDHHSMVGAVMVDRQGENYITLAPGALARLGADDVRTHAGAVESADVCIVSLEISIDAATAALQIAREHGVTTILNPAPAPPPDHAAGLLVLADWVTPNDGEAASMCGQGGTPEDRAAALRTLGARGVVMTLGADGALMATDSTMLRVPTMPIPADEMVDTAGAGDSFNAAFAVALASGLAPLAAVGLACEAGSRICRGPGFVEALDQLQGLGVPARIVLQHERDA
jgi:ribokinase